jgi:hypothetical protein
MDYDIQCEEFYNDDELDGAYEAREAYLERLSADISIDECNDIDDEIYFEEGHNQVMKTVMDIILKKELETQ